ANAGCFPEHHRGGSHRASRHRARNEGAEIRSKPPSQEGCGCWMAYQRKARRLRADRGQKLRILVAKLLQLVAVFTPYRCCKMQQEGSFTYGRPHKNPATRGSFLRSLVAACCRF